VNTSNALHSPALFWGVLLLLYSALVFWLSSAPREMPLPEFPYQDKLMHLFGYALMALIAIQWLNDLGRFSLPSAAAGGVVYAILFGASDEWHQSFVPGRNQDLADWLADLFGALLGLALFFIIHRRRLQARG